MSIANTRRTRAGYTAQLILLTVLKAMKIPCRTTRKKFKGYSPDIVIPNINALDRDENKAFVLAVKRTLRERWTEDIGVFKFPNSAFVLIKPDKDFSPAKARDMVNNGMKRVYIPDVLYNKYKDELEKSFKGVFKKLSDLPKDLHEFLKARN